MRALGAARGAAPLQGAAAPDGRRLAAAAALMMNADERAHRCASAGLPVQVVAGRGDLLCPPEGARRMAALVPGAGFHCLGGAHLPFLAHPRAWLALLRELDG